MDSRQQFRLMELVNEIRAKQPNLSLQDAMCEAIKVVSGAERVVSVASEPRKLKPAVGQKKTKKIEPVPEHIKVNRQRVRQAEQLRRETGGTLPTLTLVSGGKVSPK